MSLTSELQNLRSPVRRHFEKHYPNARTWVTIVNSVARREAPSPLGITTLSPSEASIVGTALDYRLRLCLGWYDPNQTVAVRGLAALLKELEGNTDPRPELELRALFRSIRDYFRANKRLRRQSPGRKGGLDLLRCCVLLSLLEQIFRVGLFGRYELLPQVEAALHPARGSLRDRMLSAVSIEVFRDLRLLTDVFLRTQRDLLRPRPVLNPNFDGSEFVGGADADFIAGRELVEMKSTRQNSPVGRRDVYQLLGYLLLDWSDTYRIKTVSFYLARRASRFPIEVNEFLRMLAGEQVALNDARERFVRSMRVRSWKRWRELKIQAR